MREGGILLLETAPSISHGSLNRGVLELEPGQLQRQRTQYLYYNVTRLSFLYPYMPLFMVFCSSLAFSLETLFVKLLEIDNFRGSFFILFCRGWILFIVAGAIIYSERLESLKSRNGASPNVANLCGPTIFVTFLLVLRSVFGFGAIGFKFLAVEIIPLGDATVLVLLAPLVAAFGAWRILGEPWFIAEFSAILMSLCGAALVCRPPFIFSHFETRHGDFVPLNSLGVFYALSGAFCAGSAYITVRMLGTTYKMPWSNVCFAQACGMIVLSLPALFISGQTLSAASSLSHYQIGLIVGGGIIGAVAQVTMTIGMQREKSASATAMRMVDVVFGYCWQVAFTADKLSVLSMVGTVLISVSVIMIVLNKHQHVDANANVTSPPPSVDYMTNLQHIQGTEHGCNPLLQVVDSSLSMHSINNNDDEEEEENEEFQDNKIQNHNETTKIYSSLSQKEEYGIS